MPRDKLTTDRRFRATLQKVAAEQLATDGAVGEIADGVLTLDQRLDEVEGGGGGVRTVTGNDAFGPGDSMILVDASGGAVTLDLPSAAAGPRNVTAQKIDASLNAVTLVAVGGDTLNGTASTTTQFATISAATAGTSADWYGS